MFNFNSAQCKNRTSCREGLRLDSFNEKAPPAQKPRCSAGSPACSLCQRSRGKRKTLKVRYSFHTLLLFPPFSPFLAPLCIFLLLHLFPLSPPTWLASSLGRPARPPLFHHLYVSFLFLLRGDWSSSRALLPHLHCLPAGAAGLTNFSRNCSPNPFPSLAPFTKPQTLKMELQRSIRSGDMSFKGWFFSYSLI